MFQAGHSSVRVEKCYRNNDDGVGYGKDKEWVVEESVVEMQVQETVCRPCGTARGALQMCEEV